MADSRIPKYVGPDTSKRTEKMSKEEIRGRFDKETASVYSRKDPAWLPEFRFATDTVARLVKPFAGNGGRVLDIGAGTGNLSRVILQDVEGASVTLMDFSKNMLSEVPNVLSAFAGRYDVKVGDFMEDGLGRGEFSAVVSSFAIHHCRGNGRYLDLYKKIAACLTRPGIFVCLDVVAGDGPFLSEENENGWASFLRDQGFPEQDIQRILSNYHVEDSPISVGSHMRLLSEAGFTVVDTAWKKFNFGIYLGIV
jgi:ubiquinone/menaquinone biosynthesis C-methylase UbiE